MASIRSPFGAAVTLAEADDVDRSEGVNLDLTGAAGAVIVAQNIGTAGTLGIDLVQVSKDGGTTWADALVRDSAGDLTAEDGELNAAGTEVDAIFTMHPQDGQMNGPTVIRVRGTNWATGAPAVLGVRIG